MTQPRPLLDVRDADLDRHGVIEASAGTGKTHALQHLVLRILREGRAAVDEILVVTYTEKATGELRRRIRRAVADALCDPSLPEAERRRLGEAWRRLDEAAVSTLHGFCHQVLRRHPFASGEPVGLEPADDAAVAAEALHALQRGGWRERYGADLPALLATARYPGGTSFIGDWDGDILDIALSWTPEAGDALLPPPQAGDLAPSAFEEAYRDILADLGDALGDRLSTDAPDESRFAEDVRALLKAGKVHGSTAKSRMERLVLPLLADAAAVRRGEEPQSILAFLRALEGLAGFTRLGFPVLIYSKKADGPIDNDAVRAACPLLPDLLDRLDALRSAEDIPHRFAAETVRDLRGGVDALKRARGLLGFGDMLIRLDAALDAARNPRADELRAVLRGRFRYALVDEFQDTDRVQWRILRRLFTGDGAPGRLFLIGDPKQAIYGFRGADVETYLAASDALLGPSGGAEAYRLDINWRSSPALVAAQNRIFGARPGGESWFAPADEEADRGTRGIVYAPVAHPRDAGKTPPRRIAADATGRPAVTCIAPPDEAASPALSRHRCAVFAADEIARLLGLDGDGPLLRIAEGDDPPRPLAAGDIGVLVQRRREAEPVLRALRRRGIPFSFYKEPGLYASDEALHVLALLEGVERPADDAAAHRAFLTPFFGVDPDALARAADAGDDAPGRERLGRWRDLADRRRWAEFFRSLLEESAALGDGGATPSGADPIRRERRLTNYRHIFQTLEREAAETDADLAALVQLLRGWRRRTRDLDQDADLQRLETERPAVRILTLHASKGLEFPVVFVLGGYTSGRPPTAHKYHAPVDDPDASGIHYDLARRHKDEHEREEADEHRRLFYVALTRARHKLYVPLVPKPKGGAAGPLVTLVGPLLRAALDGAPPECLGAVRLDPFGHEAAPPARTDTASSPTEETGPAPDGSEAGEPDADAPRSARPAPGDSDEPDRSAAPRPVLRPAAAVAPGVRFHDRAEAAFSFSSLLRGEPHAPPPSLDAAAPPPRERDEYLTADARVTGDEEDADPPPDAVEPDADDGGAAPAHPSEPAPGSAADSGRGEAEDLPPGAASGSAVHEVFETIDFARVLAAPDPDALWEEASAQSLLHAALRRHGVIAKGAKPDAAAGPGRALARLVWTALRKPLRGAGPLAALPPLGSLPPEDCLPEVQFDIALTHALAPTPGGRDGFLTGAIDLVFRVPAASGESVYCLLDWKTNRLPAYDAAALEREMTHPDGHRYALQAAIYAQAALRWLEARLPGFDYERHFGGTYYLFLRGLRPDADDDAGVHHHRPPTRAALHEEAEAIRDRIDRMRG